MEPTSPILSLQVSLVVNGLICKTLTSVVPSETAIIEEPKCVRPSESWYLSSP